MRSISLHYSSFSSSLDSCNHFFAGCVTSLYLNLFGSYFFFLPLSMSPCLSLSPCLSRSFSLFFSFSHFLNMYLSIYHFLFLSVLFSTLSQPLYFCPYLYIRFSSTIFNNLFSIIWPHPFCWIHLIVYRDCFCTNFWQKLFAISFYTILLKKIYQIYTSIIFLWGM